VPALIACTVQDREALKEGYSARTKEAVFEALKEEINDVLEDEFLSKPSRALACFVAMIVEQ
jgi:hypothetical protein